MGSWVGEKDSQGVLRPTSKDARKPALYQALSLTHTATWQGGHSGGLVAPSAWLRRGGRVPGWAHLQGGRLGSQRRLAQGSPGWFQGQEKADAGFQEGGLCSSQSWLSWGWRQGQVTDALGSPVMDHLWELQGLLRGSWWNPGCSGSSLPWP